MQRMGRVTVLPGIMSVRYHAPAAAGAVSWWVVAGKTCVAAYQPKGAADIAASYVNLASPGTYNAAPGTAPTWDATSGWIFNGSTQYLTTGVIPTVFNTWTVIVRFSNVSGGATTIYYLCATDVYSGVGVIGLSPQPFTTKH